jgi:tRNA (cmo5U34)-methyltransferase
MSSHFDHKAGEWDSEGKVALMGKLAQKTKEIINITNNTKIMDFGCGTGLFGLELIGANQTLVGVDTSKGMLEVFDTKTQGHSNISSKLVDLENESMEGEFDLIVSSMAFHHLDDPAKMVHTLKSLLSENGSMAIVDLEKEDGTFHGNNEEAGVKDYGFGNETIKAWAADAGLKVEIHHINELEKNEKTFGQFLAHFSRS